MILIADSGSTKTHWFITDGKELQKCSTQGLHPSFISNERMKEIIDSELPNSFKKNIHEVYFYGTGCAEEERMKRVENVLQTIFLNSKIEVASDLLGAARACCGVRAGIVAIIGTGSSVCHYNGKTIESIRPSLGYLLSDEGSGNYLGRRLLSDYFTDNLPSFLSEQLRDKYDVSRPAVLNGLYKTEFPNRYLASFVPFLVDHKESSYIKSVVKEGFQELFIHHINTLYLKTRLPVNFNGSVGFLFQDYLMEVARANQVEVGEIIKDPGERLVKFHLK